MLYFDHNATTPVIPEANQTWFNVTEEFFGNPSSLHRIGSRAEHVMERSRESVASILQCDPLNIVWTSGATEANNLAIFQLYHRLEKNESIWVSAIEHPSILEPVSYFFKKRVSWIPSTSEGVIDLNWLNRALKNEKPGAIVAMAANNETGILQPWKTVADICESEGIIYFCDAVQWIGKMPSASLGRCKFVSASGHKFGAPKGIGFLKTDDAKFVPLFRGGGQERNRRAGTENVAGAVALSRALEICEGRLQSDVHRERAKWREEMIHRLSQELSGIRFFGGETPSLWNTISCVMPDIGCQFRWVVKLDKAGFAVSSGSACASGSEKPSHVLQAMGLNAAESSRVLRFSSSWETTAEEWNALLKGIKKLMKESILTGTAAV